MEHEMRAAGEEEGGREGGRDLQQEKIIIVALVAGLVPVDALVLVEAVKVLQPGVVKVIFGADDEGDLALCTLRPDLPKEGIGAGEGKGAGRVAVLHRLQHRDPGGQGDGRAAGLRETQIAREGM